MSTAGAQALLKTLLNVNDCSMASFLLAVLGELTPAAMARGSQHVQQLMQDMTADRLHKLVRLGFEHEPAEYLAGLHTRNVM